MTPDPGILTTVLNTFSDAFTNGLGFIHGDARWLLGTLIVIDLILAVVLNLSDGDHMRTLVSKVLKYGFFIWIVMDYKTFTNVILNTFEMIGLKAGGGSITNAMLSDPSNIATYGIWVTEPIFDFINNLGAVDVLKNLHKVIIAGWTGIVIMLCYFIIGIQIFITYLEFYLIATLALILLPFGVNRRTAFLGEKAIGAVLSFGIKLMVLAFIAAVAIPLVKTWSLPVDPTNKQMFCLLLGSLAITFLAWHAPAMAAGLLSGHPTLTTGTATGTVVAGGWAAATLGGAAIRAGHSATMAAVSGGSQVAGAYKEGGMGGVARLGRSYLSEGSQKITDPFVSSFDSGRKAAASISGDSRDDSGGATGGGSTTRGAGTSDSFSHMDFAAIRNRLRYIPNSVPPSETRKGGGTKPDLKGGDES